MLLLHRATKISSFRQKLRKLATLGQLTVASLAALIVSANSLANTFIMNRQQQYNLYNQAAAQQTGRVQQQQRSDQVSAKLAKLLERARQTSNAAQLAQQQQLQQLQQIQQQAKQLQAQKQRHHQQLVDAIKKLDEQIDRLKRQQRDAQTEANMARDIIIEHPNCQKFATRRGPNYQHPPGFNFVRYTDLKRGPNMDDIYVFLQTARLAEKTQCLVDYIITDRLTDEHCHPKSFIIPKGEHAWILVQDFWESANLCISLVNETNNQKIIDHKCYGENSRIPLPFSKTTNQHFRLTIDREWGQHLGGVYVVTEHVNVDHDPVLAAQRKLRQVIAMTSRKIDELNQQKARLQQQLAQE